MSVGVRARAKHYIRRREVKHSVPLVSAGNVKFEMKMRLNTITSQTAEATTVTATSQAIHGSIKWCKNGKQHKN